MPNQTVIHYYDEDEMAAIRGTIDNMIERDYSEMRGCFEWTSKDGRTVSYTEMEDVHLLNVLALMTKRLIKDYEKHPENLQKMSCKAGEYRIPIRQIHALLLIEAFYRGIIEFPVGPIEIMELAPVIKRIVKYSRHYEIRNQKPLAPAAP